MGGACVSPELNYLGGAGVSSASRKSAEGVQNHTTALRLESRVMVATPLERLQRKKNRTY